MADVLDRDDIDAALQSLPGWTYDGEALSKRVSVPADSQEALEGSVSSVADELDHHPLISRDDDSQLFRLWTHSENGVTRKDVELANRIDGVLSGSGKDSGSGSPA